MQTMTKGVAIAESLHVKIYRWFAWSMAYMFTYIGKQVCLYAVQLRAKCKHYIVPVI